jgi:hypothetical protein
MGKGAPEMRVVEDDFSEMPGQDSFLDVLTNMVGIIILLVVVVGLRTSQALIRAAVDQVTATAEAELPDMQSDVDLIKRAAVAAESQLQGVMQQVVNVRRETSLREQERAYLATYVTAFEQELDQRRSDLSAEKQKDFDLRRQLAESQLLLENLGREQIALLSQPTETQAIENQPTPIARRMTGKEVLVHLSAGHAAVIPEQLFTDMIDDVKDNIWRLREQHRFVSTVGPVNGFRLRYRVGMVPVKLAGQSDPRMAGPGRVAVMMKPELTWYEIIPESSSVGVPLANALAPDSDLRHTLREHPPDTNTIVIVVYPDSIRELHELKRVLYSEGYATADIPRPPGRRLRCSINAGRSGEYFAQ